MARSNENLVLQAVGQYLTLRKHFFWRTNNTPMWQKDHFRAMPKYSIKGVPDFIVIKDGFFVGLECKDKSPQSPDQKIFESLCKKAGGEYYLIRSVTDLKEIGL